MKALTLPTLMTPSHTSAVTVTIPYAHRKKPRTELKNSHTLDESPTYWLKHREVVKKGHLLAANRRGTRKRVNFITGPRALRSHLGSTCKFHNIPDT